ncbi:MAG: gliding motility-associated ABC transporter substrate-binding protein GldG [Bacteroidetes bacterium GWE2_41_25]|nr:MAG: gliding motility-associated ABC transporter substrate-binding protein GldG [Bacteroidetes bacterium GWA2_40_15]OFX91925.1 MAG: gliding motility-associated ABC transporter substrate-binding protein GldG [Bacteroidetes bacterium GWE2_41_25]OFX95674.1 MAG: gliding motility-associated ABC transporter substrate-binding protein GldG [Bacteroidetes bacterium GWC2_40_22]OFY57659.1 MAG: gliding motility-associated ABC transporter substrate-binding protein GldG [Bacteroidetes bacterium GWF2_41_9]
MESSVNSPKMRMKSWLHFIYTVAAVLLAASVISVLHLRLDLTEDKRYTLSVPTEEILSELKSDIFIQVFLDGDIPIPLKRLKRSVKEILDEFRIASGHRIDYEFLNPSEGSDVKQRETQYQYLIKKGLMPINIQASDAEGGSTRKIVFPGMIINCNGIEVPVNFLKNNQSLFYEQNILHSVEGLEYELIQTIATITADTVYKVAFIEGHEELNEIETADITLNLAKFFTVDRGVIGGKTGILDNYAAVIIAGPEKEIGEQDKLVLDQYIMNGGKILWLIEEVAVNQDSLVYGSTIGLYRPLNLEDMLFRYGARVNPAVVQDLECFTIRLMVMSGGSRQQVVDAPWVYYPVLMPASDHPITRNLNRVKGEFVNYIDTVGLDGSVSKKVLLHTSDYSRTLSPPLMITLKEAETIPDEQLFNKSKLPVAVLLEGTFISAFINRPVNMLTGDQNFTLKKESRETKMIIVSDADIIRNEVRRTGTEETPLTLGQDKYTGQVFGNRDFLLNCLNWLVDDKGIMELRSRELKLRILNLTRVKNEKLKWQFINTLGPLIIVLMSGLAYNYFRRRKYTRHGL